MRPASAALLAALAATSCGDRETRPARAPMTFTILATNDLHGHVEHLPVFAGYVANVRARRPVLLIDAGDMFHGTMESNLNEGEVVVRAYDAIGYDAAAIGNHDFDFGPIGAEVEPGPDDPRRQALRSRAREASFPLLSANLYRADTGERIAWDNVRPTATVDVGGVRVGVIGVATSQMPWVVRPSHFAGLRVEDPATALTREARRLRREGARVVVGIVHAGGECREHDDPGDLSSCVLDAELFRIARALEHGTIDVLAGGHKHQAVAHRVNGVTLVSAYSRGRAFSRIDVTVSGDGAVTAIRVFPPREICSNPTSDARCDPGEYEGAAVVADERVAAAIAPDLAAAAAVSKVPLGVEVAAPIPRSQTAESPLGNLLVDLMLQARPDHDLAIQNGGALRAPLPAGELTYGELYEAMSFDNHFATLELTTSALRRDLAHAFASSGDVVSVSGARIAATCVDGRVEVELSRADGTPIEDDTRLRVLTSDYLAIGGDGLFHVDTLRAADVSFDDDTMIRDAMAAVLRRRERPLRPGDFYDPAAPRVSYPGPPPLRCEARR